MVQDARAGLRNLPAILRAVRRSEGHLSREQGAELDVWLSRGRAGEVGEDSAGTFQGGSDPNSPLSLHTFLNLGRLCISPLNHNFIFFNGNK